jgi:hypothetical protein
MSCSPTSPLIIIVISREKVVRILTASEPMTANVLQNYSFESPLAEKNQSMIILAAPKVRALGGVSAKRAIGPIHICVCLTRNILGAESEHIFSLITPENMLRLSGGIV